MNRANFLFVSVSRNFFQFLRKNRDSKISPFSTLCRVHFLLFFREIVYISWNRFFFVKLKVVFSFFQTLDCVHLLLFYSSNRYFFVKLRFFFVKSLIFREIAGPSCIFHHVNSRRKNYSKTQSRRRRRGGGRGRRRLDRSSGSKFLKFSRQKYLNLGSQRGLKGSIGD